MGGSSLSEVVGEDLRAEVSLVGGSLLPEVVDKQHLRAEASLLLAGGYSLSEVVHCWK